MKYLGPHQDSSPLEITLVLRRRQGGYQAAAGWDPCTGLGSPDGQALLTALAGLGS